MIRTGNAFWPNKIQNDNFSLSSRSFGVWTSVSFGEIVLISSQATDSMHLICASLSNEQIRTGISAGRHGDG